MAASKEQINKDKSTSAVVDELAETLEKAGFISDEAGASGIRPPNPAHIVVPFGSNLPSMEHDSFSFPEKRKPMAAANNLPDWLLSDDEDDEEYGAGFNDHDFKTARRIYNDVRQHLMPGVAWEYVKDNVGSDRFVDETRINRWIESVTYTKEYPTKMDQRRDQELRKTSAKYHMMTPEEFLAQFPHDNAEHDHFYKRKRPVSEDYKEWVKIGCAEVFLGVTRSLAGEVMESASNKLFATVARYLMDCGFEIGTTFPDLFRVFKTAGSGSPKRMELCFVQDYHFVRIMSLRARQEKRRQERDSLQQSSESTSLHSLTAIPVQHGNVVANPAPGVVELQSDEDDSADELSVSRIAHGRSRHMRTSRERSSSISSRLRRKDNSGAIPDGKDDGEDEAATRRLRQLLEELQTDLNNGDLARGQQEMEPFGVRRLEGVQTEGLEKIGEQMTIMDSEEDLLFNAFSDNPNPVNATRQSSGRPVLNLRGMAAEQEASLGVGGFIRASIMAVANAPVEMPGGRESPEFTTTTTTTMVPGEFDAVGDDVAEGGNSPDFGSEEMAAKGANKGFPSDGTGDH